MPVLRTKRLKLRPLAEADLSALRRFCAQPNVQWRGTASRTD
ncbi:MAG: hypothetical protein OXF68_17055 [Gammaproteobacteria bacterium]|nr:hypothetical protein [Gammaproteobacteria bacterium]MCY4342248.1 hypothetical protein [Gammaproteobacteria bacterium]